VLDSNARARRFYEAGGWHADGAAKQDDSFGVPMTEERYRRSLPLPHLAASPPLLRVRPASARPRPLPSGRLGGRGLRVSITGCRGWRQAVHTRWNSWATAIAATPAFRCPLGGRGAAASPPAWPRPYRT
jgi:hypothetical protein